ncbi:MAG: hypothetical protein Q4C77_03495 [Eubacteriales bacterium]|nr:hypothetical protein [Eubacteriales bacterium]
MNDAELKDILLTIQNSVINLHDEVAETKRSLHDEIVETREDLHNEIVETKESLHSEIEGTRESLHNEIEDTKENLHNEIEETKENLYGVIAGLEKSVRNIELTIENEISIKIDALFDGRVDEIRHRKENMETNAKVADLEMRVDNLEKAIMAS